MLLALLLGFLLALLLAAAPPARAADVVDTALDAARLQVERIEKRLSGEAPVPGSELAESRRLLLQVQEEADRIAAEQAPELESARARLAELGPAPPTGGEAADVAEQRSGLQKTIETLDARIKLARLLVVQSQQLADQAAGQRRDRFRAALFERTESILSPGFWSELRTNAPRDLQRLRQLAGTMAEAAARTPGGAWAGLGALVVGVFALRRWLSRRLVAIAAERTPSGRVRRSVYAVAQALLAVLVPGTVAYALMRGIGWTLPETEPARVLLGSMLGAMCFSAYVAGLGAALLAATRPSWRLLPLPDEVATGLRWHPTLIGALIFVGWLVQRLASLVQASLATEVAVNGMYALALGVLLAHTVRRGERLRRRSHEVRDEREHLPRPSWMTLALFFARTLLAASVLAILIGYVALGAFVVRQVAWIATLAMTTFLLDALIDDVFTAWLASRSAPGSEAAGSAGPEGEADTPGSRLRRQAAVLVSGALRLTVALVALVLVLAPFGEGPSDLLRRTDQLRDGITVGELQLRPTAVLQAVLVFLLATVVLRAVKRWFSDRFLPTTSLDAGMRASVATLLGFLGTVVSIGLGLSAIGLALDKVAWIASALSVGIGFGLQAVVSNFVSGLILLAERPVKVGDWVALGGVEGDIRRINVRATEIQMGDRSTVIVPNSEFITKVVRNVTHQSPQGLVQIKLPMPLDTDTERARQILLQAFVDHPDVLDNPAPNVQLDGIEAGNVVFNATGFVASPRQSYGVKSALLFQVLQALPAAGLPLWKPPSMVLREPAAPPPQPGALPAPPATPA
ncbi:DUF3772 domain-containing protein [Aquincola sp. J276]|uniref:DUF3772 domain-containing protein n=1 Tax=Aquincola sp. J276 TaxID=2898432 RepID=UPI002151E1FB|nr:DUF3772 domain-containing protein [Aquincola sp. J276]MCR5868811.1 DUF3772 domain-containing protein [Aquincola sp. J276]